jgi:hypothetical protein
MLLSFFYCQAYYFIALPARATEPSRYSILGLKSVEYFCSLHPTMVGKVSIGYTFLNVHQLERQDADIQSKVEEF